MTWDEGDAVAPGDGFLGAASSISAATWTQPSAGFQWATPGGNPFGGPLVSSAISHTGVWSFSSPALTNAVQNMVSNNAGQHGFLLSPSGRALAGSTGIQIASRENSTPGVQLPTLVVDYTPTQFEESGSVETNVVRFINEGQNFRWIYDLDHDDIFVTRIGGICEVVAGGDGPRVVPYTYRYAGAPFTGVDCCTWRIESPLTGTVGTGQALFFHNLDATNPANLPPDFDRDGIRNLCDNCAYTPNGPLRGSCVAGPTVGAVCRSHLECGPGGICDLSQEDTDGNTVGNACPEPGLAMSLFAGLGLLAALSTRRR